MLNAGQLEWGFSSKDLCTLNVLLIHLPSYFQRSPYTATKHRSTGAVRFNRGKNKWRNSWWYELQQQKNQRGKIGRSSSSSFWCKSILSIIIYIFFYIKGCKGPESLMTVAAEEFRGRMIADISCKVHTGQHHLLSRNTSWMRLRSLLAWGLQQAHRLVSPVLQRLKIWTIQISTYALNWETTFKPLKKKSFSAIKWNSIQLTVLTSVFSHFFHVINTDICSVYIYFSIWWRDQSDVASYYTHARNRLRKPRICLVSTTETEWGKIHSKVFSIQTKC